MPDDHEGLKTWGALIGGSIAGRFAGNYIRRNCSPTTQRVLLHGAGVIFILIGLWIMLPDSSSWAQQSDPHNTAGFILGGFFVLLGLIGIRRTERWLRRGHPAMLQQEQQILGIHQDELDHLAHWHNYNGYWNDIEATLQLHVQLHQTTQCNHTHDWQQWVPGPRSA